MRIQQNKANLIPTSILHMSYNIWSSYLAKFYLLRAIWNGEYISHRLFSAFRHLYQLRGFGVTPWPPVRKFDWGGGQIGIFWGDFSKGHDPGYLQGLAAVMLGTIYVKSKMRVNTYSGWKNENHGHGAVLKLRRDVPGAVFDPTRALFHQTR